MEKESHIASLLAMARADGMVHAHEIVLIQSIAIRMGLESGAFERMVKYPEQLVYRMPAGRGEKLAQLAELIVLMHIDLQTDTRELAFLEKTGAHMGFSAQEVGKLVAYLQHHDLPADTTQLEAAITA
jgi:hypothetical protein